MTVAQLAQKHGVHPTMINQWKRQLLEHAAGVFAGGAQKDDAAATVAELYRQIGQLKVECDFLASRSGVAPLRRDAR
jgi:transposase